MLGSVKKSIADFKLTLVSPNKDRRRRAFRSSVKSSKPWNRPVLQNPHELRHSDGSTYSAETWKYPPLSLLSHSTICGSSIGTLRYALRTESESAVFTRTIDLPTIPAVDDELHTDSLRLVPGSLNGEPPPEEINANSPDTTFVCLDSKRFIDVSLGCGACHLGRGYETNIEHLS